MQVAKRRLVIIVGSACLALGTTWACGFPDVTFGPEAYEAGTEAGEGDADLEDVSAPDASPDAPFEEEDSGPILIDGSTLDALVVVDGGGKVDAEGCMGCDCDGDLYNDLGRSGCASAGGANDCDDKDTRTHPNQGFLFDKAEPPRNGDWDCNGTVEKLWTREDTDCAKAGLLGLGCADVFGFTAPVACGEQGTWVRCKKRPGVVTLDCVVAEQKIDTQLCR